MSSAHLQLRSCGASDSSSLSLGEMPPANALLTRATLAGPEPTLPAGARVLRGLRARPDHGVDRPGGAVRRVRVLLVLLDDDARPMPKRWSGG